MLFWIKVVSFAAIVVVINSDSSVYEPKRSIDIHEDFVVVKVGSIVQREIALTGAPSDFKIETVVSSCGCAVATPSKDSKLLIVRWAIPNESGRVSKQIQIVGTSNLNSTTISLKMRADVRKVLAFDRSTELWSLDVNSKNQDSLILKVFNRLEELDLQTTKAFVELDAIHGATGDVGKLEIPITTMSKEAVVGGAFRGWALELSLDLMKKIPPQLRSIDVVFEGINGAGKVHQVRCDVTVRRGSKLVTRMVNPGS